MLYRRFMVFLLALVLCLCTYTVSAETQTYTMGPFSYTLDDRYVLSYQEEDGLFASKASDDGNLVALCVSVDDALDACSSMGVTLDWVKQQLAGNGEYVSVFFNGIAAVNIMQEQDVLTNSLMACYLQGKLIFGFEMWINGTEQPGQELYNLLEQLANSAAQTAQAEVDALADEYTPEWEGKTRLTFGTLSFEVPGTWEAYNAEGDALYIGIDQEQEVQLRVRTGALPENAIEDTENWLREKLNALLADSEQQELQTVKVNGQTFFGWNGSTDSLNSIALSGTVKEQYVELMLAQPKEKVLSAIAMDTLIEIAQSIDEPALITRDKDGFHFCGLAWDEDPETVLRTIAQRTQRTVTRAANPSKFIGVGKLFTLLDESFPVCTVSFVPRQDDLHWWVECQLYPEDEKNPTRDAAPVWFEKLVDRAIKAYGSVTSREIDIWETADSQLKIMPLAEEENGIDAWNRAIDDGNACVRLYVSFQNMELMLEKGERSQLGLDGNEETYTVWLSLTEPSPKAEEQL